MATETKLRQLAQGGCPVYYFYSSERYLVRQAVARAAKLLAEGEDEETTVLDGAAPEIEQLIMAAGTISFSGKLGGIQQISARVACDEVDLVLFFRDPLKAENGSSEQNLLRLCDMHSVPISTNIATAEVLLRGLDQGDLDYREGIHPDIVEPLPVHRAVC